MNILEETYDSIAPSTQNIKHQELAEGNKNLHPDFNENYNLPDDIGIPSADSNTEPLILNELQDDEYRHMVQMLKEQCHGRACALVCTRLRELFEPPTILNFALGIIQGKFTQKYALEQPFFCTFLFPICLV